MTASSDWSITTLPSASSSSDILKQAAQNGAPEGTGVLVLEQTAGRGRRGAEWKSAVGGMYFSLLLRPTLPVKDWFGLSFLSSLAIRETLAPLVPQVPLSLKWPNDILAGAGSNIGKICGILIEISGDALIVGTGANINSLATPVGAKQPAVSLQDFGADITPQELARQYSANLARRYSAFLQTGFAPVREEWLSHAAHIGNSVAVSVDGDTITGCFEDLGHDGTMVLLDDQGARHHISTGDVDLIGSL